MILGKNCFLGPKMDCYEYQWPEILIFMCRNCSGMSVPFVASNLYLVWLEYHVTYWPFLKKSSILEHFGPKCGFFYALLFWNIIFVLIILNLLVKDYFLCFLATFMSFSLQNNTWELLGPTLPPNTLYPIIWGEWYLYGPILSCFIFLALSLAKSNVFRTF